MALSKILRHTAENYKLHMDQDGYISVSELQKKTKIGKINFD